ncbi:MAG: NAD(P)/FAD-dependent oxidoreductase [Hyphomonadaceae bacterium]|nr:NAD(P)/FAD-dependent oxidoreductase [Hyphomonadaceae bacterium]
MTGTSPNDFETCIVGAGAVGLACGYALARRGQSVVVIERAGRVGAGVSSRNSEVIHAGLHYPPGSLKARLCVDGRRRLYAFLAAHNVAFDRCGKLIVATQDSELPAIAALAARGEDNDVEGVTRLDARQTLALEPALRAVGALHSTESGVFDAHGYMDALVGEIEDRGGAVVLNSPFLGAEPKPGGVRVRVGGTDPATITVRTLVIAAGLQAQACAALVDGFPAQRIPPLHLGKGSYFTLAGRAPFKRLVYPPPIPGALGIHYRRDLGGQARFGPDLEFVAAEDYAVDPARAAGFEDYVRRFWPGLPAGALTPDYAGIRPKLHGPGEPQGDFVIERSVDGVVALFGIESPGLTSSLAIGEHVATGLTHAPPSP